MDTDVEKGQGGGGGEHKGGGEMSSCQQHYKGWIGGIIAAACVALAVSIALCLTLPDDDSCPEAIVCNVTNVLPDDSVMGWYSNDTGVPEGVNLTGTSFAKTIFDSMAAEQRAGQMNQYTYDTSATGPSTSDYDYDTLVKMGLVGSLFNMPNLTEVNRLQQIAFDNKQPPVLMAYDTIHGYWTIFPTNIGLGATFDRDMIRTAFNIMGSEARSDGIHQAFSPMLDLSRDSRWGRLSESFGEDVCLAKELGVAAIKGHQEVGHLSCVKHYAAYGGAESGRDYNLVDLSPQRMYGEYLQAYMAAVKQGALSVMTSFNTLNYVPATGNRNLLTNILKRAWGFKGLVVSDYTSVDELVNHGVGKDGNETSLVALRAGLDMEMAGGLWGETLMTNVQNGVITQDYIDAAAQRILYVKEQLGLGDLTDINAYLTDTTIQDRVRMNQTNQDYARQVAEAAMVLLKNGDCSNGTDADRTGSTRINIIPSTSKPLPIPITSVPNILIIGSLANSRWDQMGGWAGKGGDGFDNITVLTNHLGCKNVDGVTTTDAGPQSAFYSPLGTDKVICTYTPGYWLDYSFNSTNTALYAPLIAEIDTFMASPAAAAVTHVIFAMGEPSNSSGEATSKAHLEPCCGQQEIFDYLMAVKGNMTLNPPIINLVFSGRGMAIQPYVEQAQATVYAWFPGSLGGPAMWNVLTDQAVQGFVGRLSVSIPRTAGQCPIYYARPWTGRPHDIAKDLPYPDSSVHYSSRYDDERTEPLFNFGHGLSYANINYDSTVSCSGSISAANGGSVTCTTNLKSDSTKVVYDVPQIYIHPIVSPASHPKRLMKGFQKVSIPASGSVQVSFTLTRDDFIYYNDFIQPVVDATDYEIYIGPSNDPDWDRMTFYGYPLSPGGNTTFTIGA